MSAMQRGDSWTIVDYINDPSGLLMRWLIAAVVSFAAWTMTGPVMSRLKDLMEGRVELAFYPSVLIGFIVYLALWAFVALVALFWRFTRLNRKKGTGIYLEFLGFLPIRMRRFSLQEVTFVSEIDTYSVKQAPRSAWESKSGVGTYERRRSGSVKIETGQFSHAIKTSLSPTQSDTLANSIQIWVRGQAGQEQS